MTSATVRTSKATTALLTSMENRCKYVAAGVAGIGILGTADLSSALLQAAPAGFAAGFLTADLLSAALISLAYVSFHGDALGFATLREAQGIKDADPTPRCYAKSTGALSCYYLGLIALVAAGMLLLVASWW